MTMPKKIIIDLDNTLTIESADKDYANKTPNLIVIEKLNEYKRNGFDIVVHTARNQRKYDNRISKRNIYTIPIIIEWLNKHNIPFDELHIDKPWCGNDGFYVDDRAIRPDEFSKLSYDQIKKLVQPK